MDDPRIERRMFILTAIAASAMAVSPRSWLPGSIARADDADKPDLTQLARLLLPHPGLADDVYRDVMTSVARSLESNPDTAALLTNAEIALDAHAGGDWLHADKDGQIAALGGIEGEAFFAAILATLRGIFYYHPAVWAHLSYPGSSKELGGYRFRGFDDIDWLPEIG